MDIIIKHALQAVRKTLLWGIIISLICPPTLLYADSHGSVMVIGEEQLRYARVSPLAKVAPSDFPAEQITAIPVHKNEKGFYGLNIDQALLSGTRTLYLVDNQSPVGIVEIENNHLKFQGIGDHGFVIGGALNLSSLQARLGGSLIFYDHVNVSEKIELSAKYIKMLGQVSTKELILQAVEKLSLRGEVSSETSKFQSRIVKIKKKVSTIKDFYLQAEDIVLKTSKSDATHIGSLDIGENWVFSGKNLVIDSGSTIRAKNIPHFATETIINRGDLHSETDLQASIGKAFDHYGSLRVKRYYQVSGNENDQGNPNKLKYVNHQGSTTFIGSTQRIDTEIYQDSGITHAGALSFIKTFRGEFRAQSQYFSGRGVIQVEENLTVHPQAHLLGMDLLSLHAGRDLDIRSGARMELTNVYPFPYSNYFTHSGLSETEKAEAKRNALAADKYLPRQFEFPPQNSFFKEIMKKKDFTLSAGRNFSQSGEVSSTIASIDYRSGGKFTNQGRTSSGVFSWNHTKVSAREAETRGYMQSWNTLSFDIEGKFEAFGKLLTKNLQIRAESFKHHGQTTASGQSQVNVSGDVEHKGQWVSQHFQLKAGKLENWGHFEGLENLSIEILGPLYNGGEIKGKALRLQAKKLENVLEIKASESLQVKADRLYNTGVIEGGRHSTYQINYDFLNRGSLKGDHTSIVAGAFMNTESVYAPSSLAVSTLVDFNAGLIRTYNYSGSSLVSANLGLYIPTLPARWEDCFSSQALRSGAKMALMGILPSPVRSLFNLGSSLSGLYHTLPQIYDQGVKLFDVSRSQERSNLGLSDIIPFIVRLKDVGVSISMAKTMATSGVESFTKSSWTDLISPNGNFWTSIPDHFINVLGPRYTNDTGFGWNAGGIFSQNVYQRGIFSHHSGITVARSFTWDSLYGENSGYLLANDLSISGSHFTNSGSLSGNAVSLTGESARISGTLRAREQYQINVKDLDGTDAQFQGGHGSIKAEHLKRLQSEQFSGGSLRLDVQQYEGGINEAVALVDGTQNVGTVHLEMVKEAFVNNGDKQFKHQSLSLSVGSVDSHGNITSAGSLALHGKDHFTSYGDITAQGGLTTSTTGHHLIAGKLAAKAGNNVVVGHTIESRAFERGGVHQVSKVSAAGGHVIQRGQEGMSHQGTQFISEKTPSLRTEKGDIKLPVDEHDYQGEHGNIHGFRPVGIQSKEGIEVVTPGRIDAPALQATAVGGGILLKGDRGVSVDARSSVYRKESYDESGVLGFNSRSGYAEAANFVQSNLQAGEGVYLQAKEGGISARAVNITARDAALEARDTIDLGPEKATVRSESHESSWWGLSQKTTLVTREEAVVANIKATKTLLVSSKEGKVKGGGTKLEAPKGHIHAAKGAELNEVRLKSSIEVDSKRFCLNILGVDVIAPTEELPFINPSVSVGFKMAHSQEDRSYGEKGSLKFGHLKVSTDEGSTISLRGSDLHAAHMVADTDKVEIGGVETDTSTKGHSSKVMVGVAITPAGVPVPMGSVSGSMNHGEKKEYIAADVQVTHLEVKRAGLELRGSNGINGGIQSASGEKFTATIDHAQAAESESSLSGSIGFSGSSVSLGAGASGGTLSASNVTNFEIKNASNLEKRTDIRHEDSDTRWGVRASISADVSKMADVSSLQGLSQSMGGGVSGQVKGHSFGVDSRMAAAFKDPSSLMQGSSLDSFLGIADVAHMTATNVTTAMALAGADVGGIEKVLSDIGQGLNALNYVAANVRGIDQTFEATTALVRNGMGISPLNPPSMPVLIMEEDHSEEGSSNRKEREKPKDLRLLKDSVTVDLKARNHKKILLISLTIRNNQNRRL